MFALLLLGITSPTPHVAPSTEGIPISEVARFLESAGYPLKEFSPGMGIGTVTLRGAEVNVGLLRSPNPEDKGKKGRAVGFVLQIEIPVGVDVPLSEAIRPLNGIESLAKTAVTPHLGRTVTLSRHIGLKDGSDRDMVGAAFDKFWSQGATYARLHGGAFVKVPERDWSKARFPDGFVMERAERISLQRATASWGMNPHRDLRAFSGLEKDSIEVNGTTVHMTADTPGLKPTETVIWLASPVQLPPSVDPTAWCQAEGAKITWGKASPQPEGKVRMSQRLDVLQGIRLGDLRRAITAFAANAKALQGSLAKKS